MAKRKSKRKKDSAERLKALLSALPKWLLAMIICGGLCFGALVETGVISLYRVQELLGFSVFVGADGSVPENAKDFTVYAVDVGQGDCTLITAGGKSILIDAGEKEYGGKVVSFIRSKGIERLDFIIATHPHSDHIGGLAQVIKDIGAEKIIVPRLPDNMTPSTKTYENFLLAVKDSGGKLTAARAGAVYDIAQANGLPVSMTVVSPGEGDAFGDLNDYSVCARVDFGRVSWLFTGDLAKEGEKLLTESGRDIDVTALKVGHHGSAYSSNEDFLSAVTPQLCVISCGEGNSYGHPADAALSRLYAYTDNIFRTDISGTVSVYSEGEKFYVFTEKKQTENSYSGGSDAA